MHDPYLAEIYGSGLFLCHSTAIVDFRALQYSELRKKLYAVRWCHTIIEGHTRSWTFVATKARKRLPVATICLSFIVSEI